MGAGISSQSMQGTFLNTTKVSFSRLVPTPQFHFVFVSHHFKISVSVREDCD
jgi:hypothetical protein